MGQQQQRRAIRNSINKNFFRFVSALEPFFGRKSVVFFLSPTFFSVGYFDLPVVSAIKNVHECFFHALCLCVPLLRQLLASETFDLRLIIKCDLDTQRNIQPIIVMILTLFIYQTRKENSVWGPKSAHEYIQYISRVFRNKSFARCLITVDWFVVVRVVVLSVFPTALCFIQSFDVL